MERKTPEEWLIDIGIKHNVMDGENRQEAIENAKCMQDPATIAMFEAFDAYANQEMILFLEWADSEYLTRDIDTGLWWNTAQTKFYTTQQLLTLYKEQQDGK